MTGSLDFITLRKCRWNTVKHFNDFSIINSHSCTEISIWFFPDALFDWIGGGGGGCLAIATHSNQLSHFHRLLSIRFGSYFLFLNVHFVFIHSKLEIGILERENHLYRHIYKTTSPVFHSICFSIFTILFTFSSIIFSSFPYV